MNTKIVDNPARKTATAAVREAEKILAGAERELAGLLTDPAITPAVKNAAIPALQDNITRARQAVTAATTARKPIPAKLPASDIDPDARTALLRAGRRGLQMVLRLLARNAEHWLSNQLNAYLRDDDEYRAITRQTIIRGLAGTITWTPAAITVHLEQPRAPRIARALALLIEEINATPPAMPGNNRPITYHLTPKHIGQHRHPPGTSQTDKPAENRHHAISNQPRATPESSRLTPPGNRHPCTHGTQSPQHPR